MQLNKTMRIAGVSLSTAALALLTAEGTAAAHERASSAGLRGRVVSVGAGDFVLKKSDGSTETVDTTGGTNYAEPGSSVAPTGVLDGENVVVTLDSTASSPTATNVIVFPERVSGRVTGVSGSTVTVTNRRGNETFTLTPGTKYFEKGTSPTGVGDGEFVIATGLPLPSTPDDIVAEVVAIVSPQPQSQGPKPPPTPNTAAVNQGPHLAAPQGQPATPPDVGSGGAIPVRPGGPESSFPRGPSGGHSGSGSPGPQGGSPGAGQGGPGR